MTPIAFHRLPDGCLIALFNEPLNFTERFKHIYPIALSLDPNGARAHCAYLKGCQTCPFRPLPQEPYNCQTSISRRSPHLLALFDITPDTHPEHFI